MSVAGRSPDPGRLNVSLNARVLLPIQRAMRSSLICLLFLPAFMSALCLAQNENSAAEKERKTIPVRENPAGASAANAPTGGGEDQLVTLKFPNADVRDVLALYEKLTGKRLLVDNQVIGSVNIVFGQPVPKGKAVELLEHSLFANGFSLIDLDPETIQVVGHGRNPRGAAAIPIVESPEALPRGERVVTLIFKIAHRPVADVAQFLSMQLVPSPGQYTHVGMDAKTGLLLVTERTSILRTLAPLVKALDVPDPAK